MTTTPDDPIVVTGMGAVTPLGVGVAKNWERLIAGKSGIISPIVRWILTIGAVLWFPIVQPILAILAETSWTWGSIKIGVLLIKLFSAAYLLESAGFLLIYFLALWAILRWDTQRRVNKLIERWKATSSIDAPLSLSGQVMEWMDELLDPIRFHRDRIASLVERVEALRSELRESREAA